MHFSTLLLAATALLLSTTLAAPALEPETAAATYKWQVTKWTFCRGQTAYDYSFTITGKANGGTPAFTANCSGTQKGGYKACSVLSVNGQPKPDVSANVNIVVDPENSNDSIPRVFVRTTYTDGEGCRYTSTGRYDATGNCGSSTGRKFGITPVNTAVC